MSSAPANGVQHDRPVPHPGLDTWSNRHAAALVAYVDAKAAAELAPRDEGLARAARDRLDDVARVESAACGDLNFMLRMALKHNVRVLTAFLADALRDELETMGRAIAGLEQVRAPR